MNIKDASIKIMNELKEEAPEVPRYIINAAHETLMNRWIKKQLIEKLNRGDV